MRPPVLHWSEEGPLGRWEPAPRALSIRWDLTGEGWGVVQSVLHHEMAHQFVTEVLGIVEAPHGPAFQQVCRQRGIDGRASGMPDAHDEASDAILERLSKLLSLTRSDNIHEAQVAMAAAQRLMKKHNLQAAGGTDLSSYTWARLGPVRLRAPAHEVYLGSILDRHFFVQVVRCRAFVPSKGKWGLQTEILGTPGNVEIAAYVWDVVLAHGEAALKAHRKAHPGRTVDRRAFLVGLMRGFDEQLATQKATDEKLGLVWLGDPILGSYAQARYPRLSRRRGPSVRAGEDYQEGQAHGRRISVRRGLRRDDGSSATSRVKRLLTRRRG